MRYEAAKFRVDESTKFHKLVVPSRTQKKGQVNRSAILGPVLFALTGLFFFYYNNISEFFKSKKQVAPASPTNKEKKSQSRERS